MILVDGSMGEGGGQILRSAITISILIGKPVKVVNIRSNRKDPGLKQQHVSILQLLSRIFDIRTENVVVGADWVEFKAHKNLEINSEKDKVHVDIGTAGSIPLLLQTLIPIISIFQKNLVLRIQGGTDVRYSPTIDYTKYVHRDVLSRIGITFNINVIKRGFYPKGQGIVDVEIKKISDLHTVELCNFKETQPNISSIAGRLPRHVPDRQIEYAITTLEKKGIKTIKHKSAIENSESPGSSILVYSTSDSGIYLGADSIGEKGIRAETIGYNAAIKFIADHEAQACVDQHLADMLVLPLSFVKGKSRYKISKITNHLSTNLELIRKLNGIDYSLEKIADNDFIVSIVGNPVI
ncbi:MAG TPA: RNA 3'-terminal phosphate cyclase [Candidatus Saccharimonadales bacterium]|nr:RNA 3'-terminal phosphate cyclase [Candidatus Saccharimonadales bacterium]